MSAAEKFLKGGFCSVSSAPACSIIIKETQTAGKPNLPQLPSGFGARTSASLRLSSVACAPNPLCNAPKQRVSYSSLFCPFYKRSERLATPKDISPLAKRLLPLGSCCLMNIRPTHPAVTVGRLQPFGLPQRPLCAYPSYQNKKLHKLKNFKKRLDTATNLL